MIFDISQELTSCQVYPGDPKPELKKINDMNNGDQYNLSMLSMCCHNGTHIDAPSHFLANGKTVDEISLDHFVGECYVYDFNGEMSAVDAEKIVMEVSQPRILFKGDCTILPSAAKVFAKENILLLGICGQSFGPINSPKEVHTILLNANIVLLEGLILDDVPTNTYLLCAQPLNIKGAEGSPCRAMLIEK